MRRCPPREVAPHWIDAATTLIRLVLAVAILAALICSAHPRVHVGWGGVEPVVTTHRMRRS